jgi:exonuclease III
MPWCQRLEADYGMDPQIWQFLDEDPTFCCIHETHLSVKDRHYLRVKGWKTIFQANGLKKKAGVAILISNKIDFKPKVIKKDKEGHFLLIKGKIY